ncbi:MAG: hypothetical protein AAF488_13205 [Planctomycetota bacterium]
MQRLFECHAPTFQGIRLLALCLVGVSLGLFGCGGGSDGGHDHGHDHEHGDHSHDHGGGHSHVAPHDGTLVMFGEETAHLELVLDSSTGKIEGYVLDGSAANAIRVPQPKIDLWVKVGDASETVTLEARANKLSGEKPGDTSEFEGRSALLAGATSFDGSVVEITVRGTKFENVSFPFPLGNH